MNYYGRLFELASECHAICPNVFVMSHSAALFG